MAELDFWFDFASNYSYLSVMRITTLAAQARVKVRWRPFLLGPIFQAQGWDNSPFVLQKAKGLYVQQDMVRQCHQYGLPWQTPSVFPRLSVLPARIALLAADLPWMSDFCQQVMLYNFGLDRDMADPLTMREILQQLGQDDVGILAQAQSASIKQALCVQTDRAMALNIFGAPTMMVGDAMFWGNDRLEDALAFAREGQQVKKRINHI
ncbi:2-hydroxychromene-2-carboxylate isomerase [Ampullimonas aquatilis]|uniref:2-hydroxychromene-2-carboxylate isomerase n=1 Tax=Ampullimonas aquatilis TaxID=1341549 RepID=UPI003C729D71